MKFNLFLEADDEEEDKKKHDEDDDEEDKDDDKDKVADIVVIADNANTILGNFGK